METGFEAWENQPANNRVLSVAVNLGTIGSISQSAFYCGSEQTRSFSQQ
jgi:hypothetical protein